MISVKSKPAKRILAAHLEETEKPGVTMLDMLKAFGEHTGAVEVVYYEGPEQEKLVKELKAMRDQIADTALSKSRKALSDTKV